MAKKKDKDRPGPRAIPAHWQTPATPAAPPVDWVNPTAWPLGPCWATRIDHIGSQGLYLSRQRPVGNLTMVCGIMNEVRGLVDGLSDPAISPARLKTYVSAVSGPFGHGYAVPPEYVAFRLRQGEQISQRRGQEPHPDYRRLRSLLEGVPADLDLEALEAERNRPAVLDRTAGLAYAIEFSDWWLSPEDNILVQQFVAAADEAVQDLPEDWEAEEDDDGGDFLKDYSELLTETTIMAASLPMTPEAKVALEPVLDTWGMRIFDPDTTERYRQRLLNMAYLVDHAGQPVLCSLAATAAWGLSPQRGFPAAHHPFLRELLIQSVQRSVMLS